MKKLIFYTSLFLCLASFNAKALPHAYIQYTPLTNDLNYYYADVELCLYTDGSHTVPYYVPNGTVNVNVREMIIHYNNNTAETDVVQYPVYQTVTTIISGALVDIYDFYPQPAKYTSFRYYADFGDGYVDDGGDDSNL